MNIEIWRNIDGYSNYQVSNLGRVKSLNYKRTQKEKLLKPVTDKSGYLFVDLCKNGKLKRCLVHRLVATAFIPNPNNLPCIDHIDTNKTDNKVENLRWCTHRENMNNPITLVRMSDCKKGELAPMYGRRGELNPNSKPILQLSINGDFIKKWDCSMDIQRELGFNQSNISQCCNGKRNTANGYKWCFAS